MEKMNFSVNINAPKEKVWNALWDDVSYRNWTSAFAAGSYAVTDNWEEGTKVLFLDAKGSGMVSKVAVNKPSEFMSFEHIGEVRDGVEDTTSEAVMQWKGATENYTLKPVADGTLLCVEMEANISESFKEYFEKTWPLALEKLKSLAEENSIL
ncbi:MAG: SRPBCC domain-containing protein [Panacibacter sp.]